MAKLKELELKDYNFNTNDAADYLSLSRSTLANLRSIGTNSPPYYKLGSKVIYKKSDLDGWMNERKRTCTAQDYLYDVSKDGDIAQSKVSVGGNNNV